jgi:hypothetical protein
MRKSGFSYRGSLTLVYTAVLLFAILLSQPAFAQSGSGNDWEFRLTPYLFATGLDGQIGFGDALPPTTVSASFSDVLDLAFMLYGEAKKGRWGVWGDAMYVDLGVENEQPFPIVLIYSGIALDVSLTTFSAGGSYSLLNTGDGSLDLVAGGRHWSVDQDLTFVGFSESVPDKTISAGDSWTDPVIGLRGRTNISDRWNLNGQVVGGVGGQSESSIDVFANIGYAFNDLFTLGLGYRYLDVNYDGDEFLFDVEFKGPLIGGAFTW